MTHTTMNTAPACASSGIPCRKQGLLLLVLLATTLLPSCGDPAGRSTPQDEVDLGGMTLANAPVTDCSTSTSPLRNILMYSLLGIGWYWMPDLAMGDSYKVYWELPEGITLGSGEHLSFIADMGRLFPCSGSHGAYLNLMDGKADFIIDSRDISRSEAAYSEQEGVPLLTKPVARDALIFIVNKDNPVDNLSSGQIRKIYTGRITNWKEVGGPDLAISPYVRDQDSGSQEKMETLVMRGEKMKEFPQFTGGSMSFPYASVSGDKSGIGYTPYYYCTSMVRDLDEYKILGVDGVLPDRATVRSGKYPFCSYIYAALRKSEDGDSFARRLYDLMDTDRGREFIAESGYIPMDD